MLSFLAYLETSFISPADIRFLLWAIYHRYSCCQKIVISDCTALCASMPCIMCLSEYNFGNRWRWRAEQWIRGDLSLASVSHHFSDSMALFLVLTKSIACCRIVSIPLSWIYCLSFSVILAAFGSFGTVQKKRERMKSTRSPLFEK